MGGKGQYQAEKQRNPKLYEEAIAQIDEYLSQKKVTGRFSKRKQRHIKFDQEKQAVLKLICKSEKTAITAMGNPESLVDALIESASLGISLHPSLGYAYLVPETFGDKPSIGLVIGYKGLEQLALKTRTVKQITTELVYSNDKFRRGMKEDGSTFVDFEAARGVRDELEGGFCRALMSNGTMHIEWMSANELEGCKAAATRKQGGTPASWSGDFRGEMYKKCIVRRAAKHWIIDDEFAAVLATMDRLDPMDFSPEKEAPPVEEVVTLTDEHHKIIKGILLNEKHMNIEQINGWIERQSEAFGYKGGSAELPDARWEELRDRLVARADNMIKLQQEKVAEKDTGEVS